MFHSTRLARSAPAALGLAVALTALIATTAVVPVASARPCSPRFCPEPPPPPPPPPPTRIELSKDICSTRQTPACPLSADAYGAQHVRTTLRVGHEINNKTGAVVRTFLRSYYHVWNDWAFQGWHVTVREQVYGGSGLLAITTPHVIGVSPKAIDPSGADVQTYFDTPVSAADADAVLSAEPDDTFSN